MKKHDALFFIFLTLFSAKSLAEYRVFLLHIKNKSSGSVQMLKSTLDPEQYQSLFPQLNAEFTYTDTWLCKGNTSGYKPLCDQPLTGPTSDSAQTAPAPPSP